MTEENRKRLRLAAAILFAFGAIWTTWDAAGKPGEEPIVEFFAGPPAPTQPPLVREPAHLDIAAALDCPPGAPKPCVTDALVFKVTNGSTLEVAQPMAGLTVAMAHGHPTLTPAGNLRVFGVVVNARKGSQHGTAVAGYNRDSRQILTRIHPDATYEFVVLLTDPSAKGTRTPQLPGWTTWGHMNEHGLFEQIINNN